ncbi:acetyl-CoA synthetase-like protein [Exidia glandulosa HHB12029]|uniref:Acetyl-CoA synthetase-like protein n=1 Tax=Exidia glandulosa HHB12029 TaxID=1314781 RepID=A0A165ZYE5_EXIGL|nr:acetyl-CoA synthetase-like protein [Exidia glandulosa HHB12029]
MTTAADAADHGQSKPNTPAADEIVGAGQDETNSIGDKDIDKLEFWRTKVEGWTPESFPDLTGLRARAKGTERGSVAIPVEREISRAVLETGWSFLLHMYAEAENPDVVFGVTGGGLRRVTAEEAARMSSSEVVHKFEEDTETEKLFLPFALDGPEFEFDTFVGACEDVTKFAACVSLDADGKKLHMNFTPHVLTAAAATCVLEQLSDVVDFLLASPNAPFLDAVQGIRPELQAALNPRPEKFVVPETELLHSAFERNARDHPDKLALWFKDESGGEDVKWSYAELDAKATKLARAIQKAAGKAGVVDCAVPLCMEKTPALYVAILGALKAGGAWCPIDPAFPPLRKRDLLTRCGGRVVVVRTASEREQLIADEALPVEREVTVLAVDEVLAAPDDESDTEVECGARANTLAYLIWTSGTTGAPKGVPIEHSAAVQSIAALHRDIPYDPLLDVRCIQFSAFTFDVSVQDFFYTWGAPAGMLCSASRSLLLGSFPELCNAFEITHAFLTPAFMATTSLEACKTIKTLTSIGEKLPDAVADAWCAEGVVSVNTYGPAESTIVSTVRTWIPNEGTKAHNVGRPLSTISCFAVKEDRVLPRGAAGELAIGGYQNARGYLAQPDKTAAKFVDHPVAGKVYLTGDVVRILHDGSIEFVGRTDDLVKLGGVRVELSEISALIATSEPKPSWGPVATLQLSRPDRPQNVICAFIACKTATDAEAVEVANDAKERAIKTLPSYMVPNVFLVVPRIPTTPSNKIDRAALKTVYASIDLAKWESLLSASSSTTSTDEDETVQKIKEVVAALTGAPLEVVGADTPLNALGVDSIRAIQLAARIRALNLGRELAVLDVLEHPTARLLAAFLKSSSTDVSSEDEQAIRRLEAFNELWLPRIREQLGEGVQDVYPCLPLQEGMLSEQALHHRAYWSHTALVLRPAVDAEKLHETWGAMARAYEMLRTGFVMPSTNDSGDVTFVQVLYTPDALTIDWSEMCGDALKAMAAARAEEVMSAAVGSSRPPWALTLLKAGSERMLLFSAHHSIYDADTISFLLADAAALYAGTTKDLPSRPPLRDVLASLLPSPEDIEEAQRAWTAHLAPFADPEPHALPDLTGSGKRAKTGHISSRRTLTTLPDTANVGDLARLAWALVLGAYTESPEGRVVFGETLSARRRELSRALGPLLSVVPVALDVGPSRTAREVLKTLAETTRGAAGVSVGVYREALKRAREKSAWEAMFVLHPELEDDAGGAEGALWEVVRDAVPLYVEHGWALNVELRGGRVELDLWADSALISQQQLTLLVEQVDVTITALAERPDIPFATLFSSYLPKHLLSYSEPDTPQTILDAPDFPPTRWLEHYAQEHPDWTAAIVASRIEDDGADIRSWTYAELDQAANRAAHFILSKGLKKTTIAFCVGKTLEAYAYQIGIFKTGNCYLPIEEDLPPARKALLVKDSAAAMVFTTTEQAGNFKDVPDGVHVVIVDSRAHLDELACQPATAPLVDYDRHAPGYLLYTSGSTGMPKGVLVSHGNLVSFIECFYELVNKHCPLAPFAGKGRFLGRTSIAFDVHLLEIFAAFRFGMATATAPRHIILADLGNTLRHLRISHSCLVPSLLERSGLVPSDVPELRWASVGEVTIGCSMARVTAISSPRDIGRIFDGNQAHVFRPGTEELTLRGQPGELCVSGDLVGIGYLNRPDAKGFLRMNDGKMLYRTGDMVRLMVDDTLEYLGRSDDQTKIRGQRLELAEVSECIRASSNGSLAVASLVAQHPSLKRDLLLSFVSHVSRAPKDNDELPVILHSEGELCQRLLFACRERLPSFMVPDLIIAVDFVPLALISRKIDAKLLRRTFGEASMDALMGGGTTQPQRAMTEREARVRDVILSMLPARLEEVTYLTTTLQLGLDSLGAIRLAARLAAAGLAVPVAFLAKGPSVEAIAHRSSSSTTHGVDDQRARVRHDMDVLNRRVRSLLPSAMKVDAVLPTLPLQESLVARCLDAPVPLYVNHQLFLLDPKYSATVRGHLLAAAEENEILRTCFVTVDNTIAQVVLSPGSSEHLVSIKVVDDGVDPQAEIRATYDTVARDIIDNISVVPPLRATLWQTQQDTYLSLSMHHAIYDGQFSLSLGNNHSLPMLLQEIESRILGSHTITRTPFKDVVEFVATQSLDEARKFYESYMKDASPQPELPGVDDPWQHQSFELVHNLSLAEIGETARAAGISVHAFTQAAYAAALAEYLRVADIVIGVVLSGRTLSVPACDTVLGPCITTVPIRVQLAPSNNIAAVAGVLQSDTEAILTHQHTPLQLVQRWTDSSRPLFDTLFSFTRNIRTSSHSEVWRELPGAFAIDYPFAVEVEASEEHNSLRLTAVFCQEISPADAERIVRRTAAFLADPALIPSRSNGTSSSRPVTSQYDETIWDDREEAIRACVADVCGVPASAVTKNIAFLRLGVDSITGIRLAQRLRSLGLRVRSADILRFPSVGALARFLSETDQSQTREVDPTVTFIKSSEQLLADLGSNLPTVTSKDGILNIYPTTALQTAMLTSTLASGGTLYVVAHPFELEEFVDVPRLRSAWLDVVRRTQVLRTTFHEGSDHAWIAAVHLDVHLRWSESSCRDDKVPLAVRSIAAQSSIREPSDFETPLYHVHIIVTPTRTLMVLVIHHALYDGTSLLYMLQDVKAAYHGLDPQPRPQFSAALPFILHRPHDAVDFWRQRLSGYTAVKCPSGNPDAAAILCERRSALRTEVIEQATQAMETTVQAAALLAWAKVYTSFVGRRDVVFGHVISGRSIPLDGALLAAGPLFNTIPVRVTLGNDAETNEEIARGIHISHALAEPYQHTPLREIQNAWRQGSGSKLFDALFVFQRVEQDVIDGHSDIMRPYVSGDDLYEPEYDLNAEVEYTADHLILRLGCARGTLNEGELSALLDAMDSALADIVEHPHQAAVQLPAGLKSLPPVSTSSDAASTTGSSTVVDESSADPEFTADEAVLREVVTEIAQVALERLGPRTPFYTVGIDSISALQIVARARRKGLQLAISDVLSGMHVQGACKARDARLASAARQPATADAEVPLDVRDRVLVHLRRAAEDVQAVLPVLPGQRHHLAAWLEAGRTFYELPFAYSAPKPLDPARLKSAWNALRKTHPILRTTFAATSATDVFQVVFRDTAPTPAYAYRFVESSVGIDAAVKAQITDDMEHPSDAYSPPVRARHIRAGDKDAFMLMIHHSLYDAWSLPLLMADLCRLYEGEAPSSNADFPTLVRHIASHEDKASDEKYWAKYLHGARPTLLKGEEGAPRDAFSFIQGVFSDADELAKACNQRDVSLPTLLIICLARTLAQSSHLSNASSFVLGLFQTGRSSSFENVERVAGPTLTLLPLSVPLDSVKEAVGDVQQALATRSAHEQVDVADIARWIGVKGPLFNVYVNVLWHSDRIWDQESNVLKRMDVGDATDFAPKGPIEGKTAVDMIDISNIPKESINIDIALNPKTNAVDLGIRCEGALMSANAIERLVEGFTTQVREALKEVMSAE